MFAETHQTKRMLLTLILLKNDSTNDIFSKVCNFQGGPPYPFDRLPIEPNILSNRSNRNRFGIGFGPFRTVSEPFSDRFEPFRTVFGPFRTISDRFRTVSDRFRTVSDGFGPFSDRFGRFRIVFGPFRTVFGCFPTVFGRLRS